MPTYGKSQLIAQVKAGHSPRFVHFLDYRAAPGTALGKSCLSQWWRAPFQAAGLVFPTAEHFMMHAKARLFGDETTAGEILRAAHPHEAKILGRRVRGFDGEVWDRARERIVAQGCLEKFRQNAAERLYLLGTGNAVLVEATAEDAIWGSGLWETSPLANRPDFWPGLNLLGFILMEVRSELARESS